MKKFIDGVVFGFGFGVAFVLVAYLGFVTLFIPKLESLAGAAVVSIGGKDKYEPSGSSAPKNESVSKLPFHELGIEDQIKYSSVIAVAKFQPESDGRMKAVISEILKFDKEAEFHYAIGDEYRHSSYYPKEGESRGDGVVIFFVGSPADMRLAMSFHGDRIGGLGDMPMELFREKCK